MQALQGAGKMPQLQPAAVSTAASVHSRMQPSSRQPGPTACPAQNAAGSWRSAEAGPSEVPAPRTAGQPASLQLLSTTECVHSACHQKVHQALQSAGEVLQLRMQAHFAVPTAVQAASAGAARRSRLHPLPGRAGTASFSGTHSAALKEPLGRHRLPSEGLAGCHRRCMCY